MLNTDSMLPVCSMIPSLGQGIKMGLGLQSDLFVQQINQSYCFPNKVCLSVGIIWSDSLILRFGMDGELDLLKKKMHVILLGKMQFTFLTTCLVVQKTNKKENLCTKKG